MKKIEQILALAGFRDELPLKFGFLRKKTSLATV